MACIGRCGIYKDRPQFCEDYPTVTSFLPAGCTYHFVGEERRGECQPEACQQGNCCAIPREGGEPEAKAIDSLAGGEPCKHLRWEESPIVVVKVASDTTPSATSELVGKVARLFKEI